MTDSVPLDDLYQEIILDHFKNPRNVQKLSDEEVLIEEENPTCGDQIRVTAKVEEGCIVGIKYEAKGCAISTASASMMSEALMNKPVEDARVAIQNFTRTMKGEQEMSEDESGDLIALQGVKRYPLRIKCATMSWHALDHVLDKMSVEK
ncbi:MAG: SUF system NifU family Fe-S cluster assembly protein [Kiritimatiellae bacterium]|nr:SUF system NifU family Fe-S cluster assembly protein [Kiritimatiellia bacterium]